MEASEKIRSVCVCGAGTMGSGITQVAAQAGFSVIQFDVNKTMLEKSENLIEKNLQYLTDKKKLTEKEKQKTVQRIFFTDDINKCIADIFIEAIIEKKEPKVELFNKLSSINNEDAIFTTNTSSISVSQIAEKIKNPAQLVGMHFFNPAPLMRLVEIIKTAKSSETVVQQVFQLAKDFGKIAVICKDAPGFIVNRVARQYYLEAMKLVEDGFATIETVDAVMEAAGFKMGPFKLMDMIGLDINFSASAAVWEALGKPERLRPSIIQHQKITLNELGRKTGKGFFSYAERN